jgi:hypothetical protein
VKPALAWVLALVAAVACKGSAERHDERDSDAAADDEIVDVDLSDAESPPQGLNVLGLDGTFGRSIGTQYGSAGMKVVAWSTTGRNTTVNITGARRQRLQIKAVGMWPKYVSVAPDFF